MTAPPELLALLGAIVAGGLVWLFRSGDSLAKTAAVIVAIHMTVSVLQWQASGEEMHPIKASHSLGIATIVGLGLLVLRYASWAVPAMIVAGGVILVGDLGATVVEAVGR